MTAVEVLREAFRRLPLGAAHKAGDPPTPEEIFAVGDHGSVLDVERPLIVGNRGVGKSFWSSVLTDRDARLAAAQNYTGLGLDRVLAHLGFHEAAGQRPGAAPSPDTLATLRRAGYAPLDIWKAVLLLALRAERVVDPPISERSGSLRDLIAWMMEHREESEQELRQADQLLVDRRETFLLVFDALDRLADDWDTVNELTIGILRMALDMRGYRAMRAKVFMRVDQFENPVLFQFADSSKIRNTHVRLRWARADLYGLLFHLLRRGNDNVRAFSEVTGFRPGEAGWEVLHRDEDAQRRAFYAVAGEFMGANPKRGRTYTWLHDHLADALGETTPRSFITALRTAAQQSVHRANTVIDHTGIRAGVQGASAGRVSELGEDYAWIGDVLSPLAGLTVPADRTAFLDRWHQSGTIEALQAQHPKRPHAVPLELIRPTSDGGAALLEALRRIGVIRFTDGRRVNMPDIFRVGANIKRKGGVRPPGPASH